MKELEEINEGQIGMAGATDEHNKFQAKFVTYLQMLVWCDKRFKNYDVYSQEPVQEDRKTKIPDVSIKDPSKKCVFIIEIASKLSLDRKKARVYRETGVDAEIFVYDYKNDIWYKADPITGELRKGESLSLFLNLQLTKLTNNNVFSLILDMLKRYYKKL